MSERRKQSRRALKLPDELYQRFRAYCEGRGRPMSSMMEEILRKVLAGEGVPAPSPAPGPTGPAERSSE